MAPVSKNSKKLVLGSKFDTTCNGNFVINDTLYILLIYLTIMWKQKSFIFYIDWDLENLLSNSKNNEKIFHWNLNGKKIKVDMYNLKCSQLLMIYMYELGMKNYFIKYKKLSYMMNILYRYVGKNWGTLKLWMKNN